MCMLDIVRVCFCVRHVMKQYFKLSVLLEKRANKQNGSKEKKELRICNSVSLRLTAKFAFG